MDEGPSLDGRPGPSLSGAICVVVYSVAFTAVTVVGLVPFPERIERPVQRGLLRPAAWAGERVDWAAHGWVNDVRRRLGTNRHFRAFARAVLDDAILPVDEEAGYVGTVHPPADEEPLAWLERQLAAEGYRRNPTAYLKFRVRNDGREFERGSWALRDAVDADYQLHVHLFEDGDGIDVYGHWEPSVTAGADHYGRPDFRTGVAVATASLEEAGIRLTRRSGDDGRTPRPVGPKTRPRGQARID